ncbi:hypothetical protein RFI_35754 [Reticulomyxa filosa]|uniref:Caspase family p20 domain-containing protein n=1 Tax=Reticulomyxa filosa TaxID=46433 RepID=X6LJY3_RETFI|nr:hypothetical protein RFI_35754 [Reticulomyxa filosa]|eukprot:ETO01686.1 hypothetical protein RFI_35754 [Reticulomyxa filosa]
MLVTSDGKYVLIDEMRVSFNCYKMESFKNLPKIFIIDACRCENAPKSYELAMRGNEVLYGHNDNGFLIIWSTTKGHRVADLSFLSECMKNIVISNIKMIIYSSKCCKILGQRFVQQKYGWYCVESQDTTLIGYFLQISLNAS